MPDDFQIAFADGRSIRGKDCSVDVTGAEDIEVLISADGKRVWVNSPECKLRVCGIRGQIVVNDMRKMEGEADG